METIIVSSLHQKKEKKKKAPIYLTQGLIGIFTDNCLSQLLSLKTAAWIFQYTTQPLHAL